MKFTLKNSAYPLLALVATAYLSLGISGGPNYGGSKNFRNIVGVYGGALNPVVAGSNNLGIFTVTIPQVGFATGSFDIFSTGRTFVGTIQGIGDPNKGTLNANLQAIPVVTGGGNTVTTLNEHADGSLTAHIRGSSKNSGAISSTRLTGNAYVATTVDGVTSPESHYVVAGYKQAN